MRHWKHSINIKQHLSSDTSNEAIVKAAKGIVQELKKIPASFEGIEEILYEFEHMQNVYDVDDNTYLLQEFNCKLDTLYDWADDNSIWMGLL